MEQWAHGAHLRVSHEQTWGQTGRSWWHQWLAHPKALQRWPQLVSSPQCCSQSFPPTWMSWVLPGRQPLVVPEASQISPSPLTLSNLFLIALDSPSIYEHPLHAGSVTVPIFQVRRLRPTEDRSWACSHTADHWAGCRWIIPHSTAFYSLKSYGSFLWCPLRGPLAWVSPQTSNPDASTCPSTRPSIQAQIWQLSWICMSIWWPFPKLQPLLWLSPVFSGSKAVLSAEAKP